MPTDTKMYRGKIHAQIAKVDYIICGFTLSKEDT